MSLLVFQQALPVNCSALKKNKKQKKTQLMSMLTRQTCCVY